MRSLSEMELAEVPDFEEFLSEVNMLDDLDEKRRRASIYLEKQEFFGFPAIQSTSKVVFIYAKLSKKNKRVEIVGDMTNWAGKSMTKVEGLNFFYWEFDTYPTARLDYKFIVDGKGRLDPRNPAKIPGGFGKNSELLMPEFSYPEEVTKIKKSGKLFKSGSKGKIVKIKKSEMTWEGPKPKLRVYLPYNYSKDHPLKTIYFADGIEYLKLADAKTILDNMIQDGQIEPVVAIFAKPHKKRHDWYDCSRKDYINYLDCLVDFVDTKFATVKKPESRIHIGDSLGGQISCHVGLERPNIFKLIGCHSGAFWDGRSGFLEAKVGCNMKSRLANTDPGLGLKIYFTAGYYEKRIYKDTQEVDKVLTAKGWDIKAEYLYEGHSWGQWKHTLVNMLRFLLN